MGTQYPNPPLTPEQAKALVFEHWESLRVQANRRFPRNENLAEEALNFVLAHLEMNEWERVRAWEGLATFYSFIATIVSRLLIDFQREKFGHIRKPKWISEKTDLLWEKAYRLVAVQKWDWRETIELLSTNYPERDPEFIREVVTQVRDRCAKTPRSGESMMSEYHNDEAGSNCYSAEQSLQIKDSEIIDMLERYIQANTIENESVDPRVSELLKCLRQHLSLTDEERLFLQLRHLDGLKVPAIARLLNLSGDPYKRYHKIIKRVRKACERAGIAPA